MMANNRKIKILVIEDEDFIRANILDLLEAENFQAIGADNGSLGLRKAQEQIPDLIICDIMMPGMDGYSVLTELRENPVTAAIPFIFLTAKTERDDLRLGMELGADDFITKPCSRTEMLSAIAAQMKKQATYTQQRTEEREKAKRLQERVQELQRLSENQEELLHKVSEELRNPLSNIAMAIEMLKLAPSEMARSHYLKILQQECAREIAIINQVANLQELMSPDSLRMLRRLNQPRQRTDEKDTRY